MASNYNRKSASLGSRKAAPRTRGASGSGARGGRTQAPRTGASQRSSAHPSSSRSGSVRPSLGGGGAYRAIPGGQLPNRRRGQTQQPLTSVRVGDLDRTKRAARSQKTYQHYFVRLGIGAAFVVALVVGGFIAYNSSLFTIESVSVQGVEHLTASEMQSLAGVPEGTTLLRVDTAGIKASLLQDAWVQDVSVNRIFPNTLELVVTERTIAAVVEVPSDSAQASQDWAIASDGMWLMPIPAQDSEAGKRTSPKVYEDAASVLRITDVPYATKPEVGAYCSDSSVNNALAIVDGMTTELASRVVSVKATETESTTLTIQDGPDIVFGTASNIREKERVCLEIMEQHPEGVAYINVRTVDRPTWRAL